MTEAAAALDRNVARWAERQLAAGKRGGPPAPRRRGQAVEAKGPSETAAGADARARLAELARIYSRDTLGEPSSFFSPPVPAPLRARRRGQGPEGSTIWDLQQDSDYQPFWTGARDEYLSHRENLCSHARWWRLPRGVHAQARPVLIVVHGWLAGSHWMSERVFEIPYWLHHGFDVVAFQLPFHGLRAPQDRRGPMFPSGNLARTNEAFGHAIYDLRALAAALRDELGPAPMGALGMSLGGYTAALWASVADDLDFVVPMIPAASISRMMLARGAGSPLARRLRDAGIDELALDEVFAVHSPLRRAPRVPGPARFVIAGQGDRITPAEHASALIEHWQCSHHWFAGGHLAQVGRHGALRAARLHLRALGIAGES